jgi:hypothetical protein
MIANAGTAVNGGFSLKHGTKDSATEEADCHSNAGVQFSDRFDNSRGRVSTKNLSKNWYKGSPLKLKEHPNKLFSLSLKPDTDFFETKRFPFRPPIRREAAQGEKISPLFNRGA